jgi:transposase InsO family protein
VAKLMPFLPDMEVVYVQGKTNVVADALTRSPFVKEADAVPELPQEWEHTVAAVATAEAVHKELQDGKNVTPEAMRRMQCSDPLLKALSDFKKNKRVPLELKLAQKVAAMARNMLLDHAGVLHMVPFNNADKAQLQLAVPAGPFRRQLLEEHHGTLGGHQSAAKLIASLQRRYWWETLHEDAVAHVKKCLTCAQRGVPNVKYGALEPLQVQERFHTWAVDFAGEWPRTDSGNTHLLVAVDCCTKVVELQATKSCSARDAADAIARRVVARYGAPARLVSDRGGAFTSELVKELCALLNTRHNFSVAHHPESHGQVENTIKHVERTLQAFVSEHQRDWDDKLWLVEATLRHSVHRTTGVTPFKMVTGEDAKMPIDRMLEGARADAAADSVVGNLRDMARRVKEAVTEVNDGANERAVREKQQQKKQYDARHRPPGPELAVGKLVMVERTAVLPGTSRKLNKPFTGPFRIVAAPSALNREVENCFNKDDRKLVNVKQLKPYEGEAPQTPEHEDEFYIEDILQERKGKRGTEYLIRWRGYTAKYDSWEPEKNVAGYSGDVLQRFKQRAIEARRTPAVQKRGSTDKSKKSKSKSVEKGKGGRGLLTAAD